MPSDRAIADARPGSAAFFDLDHVLMTGSSLYLLARDLRSHDVYTTRDMLRVATLRSKIRLALESNGDRHRLQTETLSSIAGRSQSEVRGWVRQLAAHEILPRIYPDMARIIAAHNAAGDRTYLITPAPGVLAVSVAQELDMFGAMGSMAELDDEGRYTGRRTEELLQGERKLRAILELADREDLDLRKSHVYSNTNNDKQLLKSVGHPHAVNPDPKLRRTAVRRGWALHELRPLRRKVLVGMPRLVPIGAGLGLGYLVGRRR